MWYKKQVAFNLDTGEQFDVICGLSDFEDDISPTLWFTYFNEVQKYNTVSLVLPTLDLKDSIEGGSLKTADIEKVINVLQEKQRQEEAQSNS